MSRLGRSRRCLLSLLLAACTTHVPLASEGAPWWDPAWNSRMPISLHYDERQAVTDVPVLVVLDPSHFDGARASPEGRDLRFVERASGRVIPHEIESWDASGTSFVWVLVPTIAAGPDQPVIDLYYGNGSAAPSSRAVGGVFDAYAAVYHLDASARDASPLGIDGTVRGTRSVPGLAASAMQFDSNADRIEFAAPDRFPSGAQTVCAWVRPDTFGGDHHVAFQHGDTDVRHELSLSRDGDAVDCWLGTTLMFHVPAALAIGHWSHTCCVAPGAGSALYIDGEAMARAPQDQAITPGPGWIGVESPAAGYPWQGALDEIRVFDGVRSDLFIRTEYRAVEGSLVVLHPTETF